MCSELLRRREIIEAYKSNIVFVTEGSTANQNKAFDHRSIQMVRFHCLLNQILSTLYATGDQIYIFMLENNK